MLNNSIDQLVFNAINLVSQNGLALKDQADYIKNNRNVVLAAVKNNGLALDYASDELVNDENIVMLAVI